MIFFISALELIYCFRVFFESLNPSPEFLNTVNLHITILLIMLLSNVNFLFKETK